MRFRRPKHLFHMLRGGTRLGPEVLTSARRAATGAQSTNPATVPPPAKLFCSVRTINLESAAERARSFGVDTHFSGASGAARLSSAAPRAVLGPQVLWRGPRSVLASPTPCTTPDAQSTAVIGPLTSYLVPARSTAGGIRSPRHLCRQRPPPRPCSPSPHCSHYILITSEDYPRPRHAQRISSSNFRGDVSDIRASTTTRRRQRSLRYRRLCRRPLYNRTKTRKTKRHFIHEFN